MLLRRKWVIIGVTGAVLATALLMSLRETPIYSSSAEVLVRPANISASASRVEFVDIETERRVASSEEVAVIARELAGGQPIGGVGVAATLNARTLVFTAASTEPAIARRTAQSFAEGYLELRQRELLDDLRAASGPMRESLRAVDADVERLQRRVLRARDNTERAVLQVQLSSLLSRKTILEQRLDELVRPDNLRVGRVIRPAGLPVRPSSPNHGRAGTLALIMGLGLALGLALLRERLDDRIRDRERLEARTGIPVLAVVPMVSGPRAEGHRLPVVTLSQPGSEAAEAYKAMRTSLVFAASKQQLKSIMITSCGPGEGKSTTTANLAAALASAGKRVVLISADLRRPTLHRYFANNSVAGLTDLLTGQRDVTDVIPDTGAHPSLLGTGPLPGNPADLLGSEEMRRLIQRVGEAADLVLLDAPGVLPVADAISLAPLVDGVLLVVDASRTKLGAVAEAKHRLEQVGARIIGAVVNNHETTGLAGYHGYGGYAAEAPAVARAAEAPAGARPDAVNGRRGGPTEPAQQQIPGRYPAREEGWSTKDPRRA